MPADRDFRAFDMGQVSRFEVTANEGDTGALWITATTQAGGLFYAAADRIWFDGEAMHWSLGAADFGSTYQHEDPT